MKKSLILAIAALVFTTINGQTAVEDDDFMDSGSPTATQPENPPSDQPQEVTPNPDDASTQEAANDRKDTVQPEGAQNEKEDTVKPESPNIDTNTANQEASKQPLYVLVPAPNPFPNLGSPPFYMRPLSPHYPQQPMGPHYNHPPPYSPSPLGLPPHHPPPFFPQPMPLPFNHPPMMPYMPMPHPMMLPSPVPPMMMTPGEANQPAPQVILLNEQKGPEGTVTGQSAVYLKHDGSRDVVIIKK